jgi:16S rRNA (guanine527-N7)-methyltransferase
MRNALPEVKDAASFAAATNVSRETLGRLNLYESLLRVWQTRINLVASATLDEIWQRHFLDSAQLMALVPAESRALVDLGSGGGFPGLVLAIMLHERASGERPAAVGSGERRPWRFVLVESDARKGAFLREVARQTGVAVEILSTRIENSETQAKLGSPDVVTARALAPLATLLGLASPLFQAHTVGLFLKGRGAQAEVVAAQAQWAFDCELVPSVTAEDASIVVVRNLRRR